MAGRGDDLWKPFKVNKLSNTFHLHAAMCDTSMIPIGHIFNAILQAMEYRKKLWGYIRRFMRLICWIHTRSEWLNYLYKPSKCQQTNYMSQWTPPPTFFFFLNQSFLSDPVSGSDRLRRWFGEISKSSSGIGTICSASGGNCSAWKYGNGQLSHSTNKFLKMFSVWLR